jgi:TRAP-type C4-dicarboxylate transport system permease small subunit
MAELIPDDDSVVKPGPKGLAGQLDKVVTWWALSGGFVFVALVVMSIISIVGRKLFSAPIDGDMELLMMGAAVGSAAFLPACEMHDHHIKVDALTTWMSVQARAALDTVAHALLMVAAIAISWRTALYTHECYENTEVSALLLIPLWQPVILLVPSFALLAAAAFYRVTVSAQQARGVTA